MPWREADCLRLSGPLAGSGGGDAGDNGDCADNCDGGSAGEAVAEAAADAVVDAVSDGTAVGCNGAAEPTLAWSKSMAMTRCSSSFHTMLLLLTSPWSTPYDLRSRSVRCISF